MFDTIAMYVTALILVLIMVRHFYKTFKGTTDGCNCASAKICQNSSGNKPAC